MPKCAFCTTTFETQKKRLSHQWEAHREQMLMYAHRGGDSPREKGDGTEAATVGATGGRKNTAAPTAVVGATSSTSEAALLRLVAQPQLVLTTPDIFIGYMCAIKRGFEGNLSQFLSIASRFFWLDRKVDPYKEVSGFDYTERHAMGTGPGGGDGGHEEPGLSSPSPEVARGRRDQPPGGNGGEDVLRDAGDSSARDTPEG